VGAPPPGFDHIVISPSNATIDPGDSQNYTAEAFDTDGNSMGNVTASTSFSISPNGSCSGNTCTASQPGNHTVTGTFSGDSDTATLTVNEPPPPPPPCPNYALTFHQRPPASIDAGQQFNVQIRVDVLEGGSADGPLTILALAVGRQLQRRRYLATWTGQGTVTFNHLTIDEPGSYSITGMRHARRPRTPRRSPSTTTADPALPSGSSWWRRDSWPRRVDALTPDEAARGARGSSWPSRSP
jgi:hypothetical protein